VPSLFVFHGHDQGARFELNGETISLGRDSGNLIQLHDTEVSRRHVEFRRVEGGYQIADLASSNGTFVNGQRVDRHPLTSGDEVRVGRTIMLFTGDGEESARKAGERVDIVSGTTAQDRSRIVRSISQEEGSRIFAHDLEASGTWLEQARSNLQIMYRTTLAVSHTLEIDQLLDRIMRLIFGWVEADRGCIMLVNPDTGELEPQAQRNRRRAKPSDRLQISKTILDYVREKNEGVLTSDAQVDDRWENAASILQMGIREAICVPMQGRYHVVGVIYIDTTTPAQRAIAGGANKFNEEHLKLMIAIAHQAALAVEDTRYYSAMVQSERLAAVGQTIAMLSHHIKNVLQGIRGGSYLIEEGLAQHNEDVVRKGWEFVEKNQERISNLVMDMLTFSKDREPELAPADLNLVVADVVELMQTRAGEHAVELAWTPAAEMPTLVFDAEGLHRAVLNVVTNAIDAVSGDEESKGKVMLRTEFSMRESMARVVVEDNGPGIPPADVDKIFTLFVSQKGGRGTGLGLPVSQKIMKEHGGRIAVDSEPGRGSRFTLELPAEFPGGATTMMRDV